MQSPAILGSEKTLVSSKRQFERARSGTHIIFDVGMNNGDDSKHYLSKGYQVVAIEANPILVERGRARFQKEIAAGQILIECVGIVDQPGKIPFWINDERDVFSSFDRARAGRNGMKCHPIEIECVTFDKLLTKYGVPYYLKLDAEGAEPYCLKCLQPTSPPEYVSVEAEDLSTWCSCGTSDTDNSRSSTKCVTIPGFRTSGMTTCFRGRLSGLAGMPTASRIGSAGFPSPAVAPALSVKKRPALGKLLKRLRTTG